MSLPQSTIFKRKALIKKKKSRDSKGLQLEVGAQRAPGLLVGTYCLGHSVIDRRMHGRIFFGDFSKL